MLHQRRFNTSGSRCSMLGTFASAQRAELLRVIEDHVSLVNCSSRAPGWSERHDLLPCAARSRPCRSKTSRTLSSCSPEPPETQFGVTHLLQVLRIARVVHDRSGHDRSSVALTCTLHERAGRSQERPPAVDQGHRIAARNTWKARETHGASGENAPDLKLHLAPSRHGAETLVQAGEISDIWHLLCLNVGDPAVRQSLDSTIRVLRPVRSRRAIPVLSVPTRPSRRFAAKEPASLQILFAGKTNLGGHPPKELQETFTTPRVDVTLSTRASVMARSQTKGAVIGGVPAQEPWPRS